MTWLKYVPVNRINSSRWCYICTEVQRKASESPSTVQTLEIRVTMLQKEDKSKDVNASLTLSMYLCDTVIPIVENDPPFA